MKVLVLGAAGMIGSAMFSVLSQSSKIEVWGGIRTGTSKKYFTPSLTDKLTVTGDIDKSDQLVRAFAAIEPNVVVNCVGLTKHRKEADDPMQAIPLNAVLPHRMADLCKASGARLIHISSDCVFAGTKGNYLEMDAPDATDIYGRTKCLGEAVTYPHAVTLRTSTIGHEFDSTYGLLEWFLSQKGTCKGFSRAVFSGLPNNVFAQIVRDIVIPRPELCGLFHVGAEPIGKYDLLQLIAREYGKTIDIVRDDAFVIDRSLNPARFNAATGYKAPAWPELIRLMHASRQA